MSLANDPLLTELLKEVSRSFYLTMRVLPGAVRWQISLAYLLARATDTIADTPLLPLDRRLAALELFRSRILGSTNTPLDLGDLARNQSTQGERVLLQKGENALGLLNALSAPDLALVRSVLETISGGQELDLRRFQSASPSQIVALQTSEELDDYTYRVAGCVGEFWTRICRAHLFPRAALDDDFLIRNGIRFGKGLQLVNILRDVSKDVGQGRCYLPASELTAAGVHPTKIGAQDEAAVRPVYNRWLQRAHDHLVAGWAYTRALPASHVRVRLACAWPILFGARTLELLRTHPVFAQPPAKITRSEVKSILRRSLVLYPFRSRWNRLGPGMDDPQT